MKQEIYEMINDYISFQISNLETKEDLIKASRILTKSAKRLEYLYSNFNQDKVYRELNRILEPLLIEDLMNEVMKNIKTLDEKGLKDLLRELAKGFNEKAKNIEDDLKVWVD